MFRFRLSDGPTHLYPGTNGGGGGGVVAKGRSLNWSIMAYIIIYAPATCSIDGYFKVTLYVNINVCLLIF